MTFDHSFVPTLRPDLLRRDIEHEAVIWSPIRRNPVALDAVATVMLEVIDGSATVNDLVDDIHEVIGVPVEVAQERVRTLLRMLEEAGALGTSTPSSAPERQRELFLNPPST